jgi:hypothetical protein
MNDLGAFLCAGTSLAQAGFVRMKVFGICICMCALMYGRQRSKTCRVHKSGLSVGCKMVSVMYHMQLMQKAPQGMQGALSTGYCETLEGVSMK